MSIDEQTRGCDYHNEIRAERDNLRAEVESLKRQLDEAYNHARLANAAVVEAHNDAEAVEQKLAMAKEIIELYVDPMNVRHEHDAVLAAISDD